MAHFGCRCGNVHGKRGLSHTRAGAHKHKVAFAHAHKHAVKSGKSGLHALHFFLVHAQLLKVVVYLYKRFFYMYEVLVFFLLGNGVNFAFRHLHQALHIFFLGICSLRHLFARGDKRAQHRFVADDVGIVAHVGRRGHGFAYKADVLLAARLVVNALVHKLVHKGDHVDAAAF